MPHLLVVEDDPDIREYLAILLRLNGYPVLTASNGQEALHTLAHARDLRLILLDLAMPEIDGYELRRQLLERPALAGVPVVLVTGHPPEDAAKLKLAGVLEKPLRHEAVLDTVRRLVATPPPGAAAAH